LTVQGLANSNSFLRFDIHFVDLIYIDPTVGFWATVIKVMIKRFGVFSGHV